MAQSDGVTRPRHLLLPQRQSHSGDVPRGNHYAVVLVAAVNKPAGRLARVVHIVGHVHGAHSVVLLDRQLVELGERLVLVISCLVHEVAVGAPRAFGERLDPRARTRRRLHVRSRARPLRPDDLSPAEAKGRKEPQPSPHSVPLPRHDVRVNGPDDVRGEGGEQH
eukprot:scaffold65303_cov28-Tisochrysis_lutea.AAC.4